MEEMNSRIFDRNDNNYSRHSSSFSSSKSPPIVTRNEAHELYCKQATVHAVHARKLCVKFGRFNEDIVLNDFSITVPVGKIFGILGPSGCGKTTFLKCLLGIIKPVSGSITAFGYAPGSFESGIPGRGVGYMPQDISLQGNLTIEEVLKFFGQLNYVDKFVLDKEIDYLIKTLDLPEGKRLISQLSVGQQRRVSYACALVHRPRLVILDEPTVGVDPILRESIWKHLTQLTRENITIIVTTHYIEEMRKASNIAFIKNGHLLLQTKPNLLLDYFSTTSLDKAFYYLSKAEDKIPYEICSMENSQQKECDEIIGKLPIRDKEMNFKLKLLMFIMNTFYLSNKLFIQLQRSPGQIATSIILPIIVITAFCVCVGETPHDIRVAVVNEDKPNNLSTRFLDTLSTFILDKRNYDNLTIALNAAKRGKVFAIIHIPKNFSTSFLARYDYSRYQRRSEWGHINSSVITYYADITHKPLFMTTKRILEDELINFVQKITRQDLHLNGLANSPPVRLCEALYSRYIFGDYSGWRDFETSGMLMLLAYSITCLSQTIALVEDYRDKIFDRIYSTGITEIQIIFSHLIARFLIAELIVLSLYVIAVHLFLLPSVGSTFWILLLLSLQAIAGMANGILITSITTNTIAISIIVNSILMTLFFISGVLWPFEGLPYFWSWVSSLSPVSRPVESLRSLLLRGWGIEHFGVYNGFLITIFWIIFYVTASKFTFRLNKKIN